MWLSLEAPAGRERELRGKIWNVKECRLNPKKQKDEPINFKVS
jgi:hypothetical protein